MASSMACATGRPSLPISRRCEEKTGLSTPSRPLPRARGGTRQSLPRHPRVAISISRLVCLDERGVTFRYKDYRRNGQARYRIMTLAPEECIRRFLLHVLPTGFHRVRH
jgi:hypothetical protein